MPSRRPKNLDDDKRTRVAFVTTQTLPRNGMETALVRLVDVFRRSADVRVIALNRQEADNSLRDLERLAGARKPHALALVRLCILMARRDDYIYIASGIWAAIPTLTISLLTRSKVIVWEHSLLPQRVAADRKIARLARIARYLYPKAVEVICVSRGVAAYVSEIAPSVRASVIPNILSPRKDDKPAAITVVEANNANCGKRLLCVGSVRQVKNYRLALQALTYLPRDYSMVIAGDGIERPKLEELSRALKVVNRVRWMGHVTNLTSLYTATDVLVHPSLVETFGFSLFEAASYNIPVVVLDAPVMNELVPRFILGTVCHDRSAAAYAASIEAAYRLRGNAEAFGAASALRSATYSPQNIEAAWLKVVQDL